MSMSTMKKRLLLPGGALLAMMQAVSAHCPLCTVGAAAAAGGAAYFGVGKGAIGVFIGAFAVSMGWWIGNMLKRQYIPYQKPALILLSVITTVLPLAPLLSETRALYIPWIGAYGKTYALNAYYAGALLGGAITCMTPWMSRKMSSWRGNRTLPYQGIVLTLALLVGAGAIMQLLL
ncbi:TPA: hypothetical protein HA228_03940 [Candidatus Woesearchaeota archaeon]|nr:hypothetical protein [Candidatus Woesearchaeota archaeon]